MQQVHARQLIAEASVQLAHDVLGQRDRVNGRGNVGRDRLQNCELIGREASPDSHLEQESAADHPFHRVVCGERLVRLPETPTVTIGHTACPTQKFGRIHSNLRRALRPNFS